MKNNFLKKVQVFALIALACGHCVFADDAKVLSVEGKVEVSRNGSSWTALNEGDVVSTGDAVSTGFKSAVVLEYRTNNQTSTIELGALTRVSFEEMLSSGDSDEVKLGMKSGSVRTVANRDANKKLSFTVKSPVATASVRGTDFLISNDGYISTFRGSVFSAPGSYAGDGGGNVYGATVVSGGQTVVIAENGIAAGTYDTSTSSATAVAKTSDTPAESTSENMGVDGLNALGVRNADLSTGISGEDNPLSISFGY